MTKFDDSHPRYESFTRLFLRNEGKVRAFVRAMMMSGAGVDDVVQEVAIVAWRKFSELKKGEEFGLWACEIARYEVLKWRKKHARDRLVFSEQTLNLLADAELKNVEQRDRERSVLDWCMQKLTDSERTLIMSISAT
jgi:RNA polymerase sigma-70 factor, ECF subfamily